MLSLFSVYEISKIKLYVQSGIKKRDAKVFLAHKIVSIFHSKHAADTALSYFEKIFRNKEIPENIKEIKIYGTPCEIISLLYQSCLVSSKSEAQRNLEQGGVRVNGNRISNRTVKFGPGSYVLQVGKHRFVRVNLKTL